MIRKSNWSGHCIETAKRPVIRTSGPSNALKTQGKGTGQGMGRGGGA